MLFAAYEPSPWMILPFGALLAIIALAPLLCADWWAKHYPKAAVSLGAITLVYYWFVLGGEARSTAARTAHEYVSFIALIGSLYVVSGGIHIAVKGESTPLANTVFLGIGAVLANFLGTTGASMLLIRPWLRMNKYRVTKHHVVFFIFIVSNVGGCLTPIGDPPLFLGYLKGIPFGWVLEHCWPIWLVGVAMLLGMFFVVDYRNYLRAPKTVRHELAEPPDRWRFEGLGNLFFLAVILGAVFVDHPLFLREALMLLAAAGSYFTTRKSVHEANHFNWHPVQEVAILFIGIFATMMPALDYLRLHAAELGNPSPALYYWGSGTLSSVLDNAPTYLNFLSATLGAHANPPLVAEVQNALANGAAANPAMLTGPNAEAIRYALAGLEKYHPQQLAAGRLNPEQIGIALLLGNPKLNLFILAVSVGAVFFGANTYIGNGPNFMVKAIAEQQKVRMPTFFGYVLKYTLPFMLPMLIVIWLLFFRG
jgi:Na+/H+ antiporter NhaD/arsenite permease-like protein